MSAQDPFALALKHARLESGLQQDDLMRALSAHVDVSQSTISRWESGKRVPTDAQYQALITVLRKLAPKHVIELEAAHSPELPAVSLAKILFGEAPTRSRRRPVPTLLTCHVVSGNTRTFTASEGTPGALHADAAISRRDKVSVIFDDDLKLAIGLGRVLAPRITTAVDTWSEDRQLPAGEKRILTIGWMSNPWYQARRGVQHPDPGTELARWKIKPNRDKKADLVLVERMHLARDSSDPAGPTAATVALVGGLGARHTQRAVELFSAAHVGMVARRIAEHTTGTGDLSVVLEVPRDRSDRLMLDELQVHPLRT